jgi:hypothetical protein
MVLRAFWTILVAETLDPRNAAREVIRALDLQTDLPHERELSAPFWLNFHLSPQSFDVMLWALIILGLGLILWSVRDRLRPPKAAPQAEAPAASPASRRLDDAQAEAEDLAGEGRFVEAMHVLLLRSLDEMRRRLALEFKESLTSREILAHAPLCARGRGALSAIIQAVERSYFGGSAGRYEDYVACRSHFEAFKASLAPSAGT